MTTVVFGAFELTNASAECERIRKFPNSPRKMFLNSKIVSKTPKTQTTMDEEAQEIDYGTHPKPSSDLIVEIPKNDESSTAPTAPTADSPSKRDDDFPQAVDVERFDRKSTDREDPLFHETTPIDEAPKSPVLPTFTNPEPLPQTHISVDSENGDYEKLNVDEADEEPEGQTIEKTDPIVVISPESTKIDTLSVNDEKEVTPKESSDKLGKCGCTFSENRHLVFAVGAGLALFAIVFAVKRCQTSGKCH